MIILLIILIIVCAVLVVFAVKGRSKSSPARDSGPVQDYTNRSGTMPSSEVDLLYRKYAPIIDGYRITPVKLFTDKLNEEHEKVLSDLNILVSNGRFQKARIDYDKDTLIIEGYLKNRQDVRENAPSDSNRELIRAIQEIKSVIKDQAMTDTVSGIEQSADDILKKIKEDPSVVTGDLRRVLDFYFPKTIECINNYKKLLKKNKLTSMEKSAKKDLESVLKSIDKSFGKIETSLVNHDAADISAEAKALQMMLENDGLTEDMLQFAKDEEK